MEFRSRVSGGRARVDLAPAGIAWLGRGAYSGRQFHGVHARRRRIRYPPGVRSRTSSSHASGGISAMVSNSDPRTFQVTGADQCRTRRISFFERQVDLTYRRKTRNIEVSCRSGLAMESGTAHAIGDPLPPSIVLVDEQDFLLSCEPGI